MRRGDIVLVDLEPVRGSEVDERRPAVIVSNDGANRMAVRLGRGVVTVIPLSARTDRIYPFQVLLTARRTGSRLTSKAQAEQIRSVAIERVGATIGRLPGDLVDELDDAIRLHLSV